MDLLIESVEKYLIDLYRSYFSIDEYANFKNNISDVKVIKSNKLTGNSFQLGIIYESISTLDDILNNNKETKELLNNIRKQIYINYKNSGFNYFDKKYLPDDLDTASTITRIIGKKVKKEYLNVVSKYSIKSGFVSTWFGINKKSKIKWATGKRLYHIDVLLNHILCMESIGEKKYVKNNIIKILNRKSIKNYWYIPSYYSIYLCSKILYLLNVKERDLLLKKMDRSLSECKDNGNNKKINVFNNECKISSVIEILISEKEKNFINKCFYFNALYNKNNIEGKKNGRIIELLKENAYTIINKKVCISDEPDALFWSLGFKSYRNWFVNIAIYLETLGNIIRFLKRIEGEKDADR